MFFREVLNEDLGCASYVVADGGEAAVVDPKWEIEAYLQIAEENGFRISHIIETHNHADHLSGRGRLVEATGAMIYISKDAGVEYEHEPLSDGDVVEVGGTRIVALATPATAPSTSRFSSRTPVGARSPGSSSPETRSSSATWPAPTSPSRPRRAPAASSARCTSCASSMTSWR